MSASNPGLIRRFFRGLWRFVDFSRRLVFNLIFVAIVVLIVVALARGGGPVLLDRTALVMDLEGSISEQRAGDLRATALDQLGGGQTPQKLLLREVVSVLDTAAADDTISSVVLLLDNLQPTGFATLREVSSAVDRFRASGKKVVAWGSGYDQRQYYIAAHADEVYLHPQGDVSLKGFGSLRNYYKDAMDKVGVKANLIRVGTFKAAAEPFILNAPSKASIEADQALYGNLWKTYTDEIEKRRKLPVGTIDADIARLPELVVAAGGDAGKLSVQLKIVDGLKTRDELRATMIERGAKDEQDKTFRQVSYAGYLSRIRPQLTGDAIGVVVAEGEIVDGKAPAGTIGGLSTANLIRKAREDDSIKAVILRVNSPGGSSFGSELVRHELELTRAAGKPVVVSMGDVAASGGYWISTASDQIVADAATITGSIGVFALLPNVADGLEKVGVHPEGVQTNWLRNAGDPRLPLDPRLAKIIQSLVDRIYADFTARVAQARKTTPEKVDAIGQGRVWTGLQARDRNLVDTIGGFDVAVKAAASRAKLGDKPRLVWVEREPGPFARLVATLNAQLHVAIGQEIDSVVAGTGTPPTVARDVRRDLGWLSDLAEHRKSYGTVVHCLCANPL